MQEAIKTFEIFYECCVRLPFQLPSSNYDELTLGDHQNDDEEDALEGFECWSDLIDTVDATDEAQALNIAALRAGHYSIEDWLDSIDFPDETFRTIVASEIY